MRIFKTWRASDIAIILDSAQTEDPIVTAIIETPIGEIEVMAAVSAIGRDLLLSQLHIQRVGPRAVQFGTGNLRRLADAMMEELDRDAIRIEGAARTTGAGKGRRQILRFERRFFPADQS